MNKIVRIVTSFSLLFLLGTGTVLAKPMLNSTMASSDWWMDQHTQSSQFYSGKYMDVSTGPMLGLTFAALQQASPTSVVRQGLWNTTDKVLFYQSVIKQSVPLARSEDLPGPDDIIDNDASGGAGSIAVGNPGPGGMIRPPIQDGQNPDGPKGDTMKVSEPGSLFLMMLGLTLIAARRSKSFISRV